MVRKKKKKSTTPTTRKRRRPAASTAPKRRRRSPRRKGMAEGLAEAVDITKRDSAVNKVMMSTIGAVGYNMITSKMPERKDRLTYGVVITVAALAMGQSRIAVGVAAATAYDYMSSQPSMAEGEIVSYIEPELLSDGEPAFLDAEGFPILREAYDFYG